MSEGGLFQQFIVSISIPYIDEELYINNTIYTEDMSGENWIPLEPVDTILAT